jgi:hypothetical protein
MINTEILAITAIFLSGFYVGYKIKEGFIKLKEYLEEIRGLE